MNKVLVLSLICLISIRGFEIDFSLLLQTGSESNDAVQAVYDLLNDLKTSNIEAQGVADEKNISDEEIGQARIAALSKVNELNQKAWTSAKARREQIGVEYREATDYIAWATQRLADIDRRSIELQELRCFSNGLFVRAIKQHNDALGVIRILKNDLSGYLTGQPSSLVEINVQNVSDKLKQYSQLFNQDAMTKFAQLATEQASGNAELHALGQDEGSSSDRQPGNNIGQMVYNALSDLEDQLKGSLANLESNEIAAYYQLADWLADTESEVVHLNDEIQRKTQLQDKLVVQEQAALAVQAKANSVLKDSQNAINAATASLQELRDLYETELNRRNEENAIIDEVIHIFKNGQLNFFWKEMININIQQYQKQQKNIIRHLYIIIALFWDNWQTQLKASLPKHNPIYTPRFDEVLTELVGTLGEAKWAEITRQMKTIYGLSIPHKPMVQARWRAIDPKINRQIFSAEETVTHWHICVKYKCHWDAVKAEYEAIGQIRDKCFLSQKFYAHFQFKLVDLNRMMGKMVAYNQPKIENMRDTTKKRILEINGREASSVKDQSAREIIQSCQMLIKLLTYVVDNHKEDYKVITEELKKIITPEKFARVLQNIFIIDLIVLIACNELKPSDETPDFIKMDERKKIKYKKPTKVKRWDEALLLSSSPENTEDEDVLRTEQEINKVTGGTNFTKADMEEIKQSPIYCVCNTDQNQTFYDWYNEAKIQKATLKTDLLVDVMDIMNNKEKQKSEKSKPVVQKRTALLAKKQMKLIEKKKNELMKQDKDDKIKTVRGKIKIDKEVFPGCYTKFFDKEDEDDYEDSQDNPIYSAIDADQIYQIIMQQKQAQDN